MIKRHLLIGLGLVLLSACTDSPKSSKLLPELEEKMGLEQKGLTKLEEKIKEVEFDPGLKSTLVEEKELAKSRLERLKEKITAEHKRLGIVVKEAAEGGHGEGGHAEAKGEGEGHAPASEQHGEH